MTFANLANGQSVFLDANTLIYHFVPHPLQPACQALLERIARQEIQGFTAADVLSDVAHRIMTLEAISTLGLPAARIAQRLRNHPDNIQKLGVFRKDVEEVPTFGVQVLPITGDLVIAAAELSQKYGLLSNDALIVAVMQHHGLTNIASNDPDFDRVPGINRYAPT